MLILLPPSEAKAASGRGRPTDDGSLSFPDLAEARQEVAARLAEVSAAQEAPRLLGVSPNLLDEIARNLVLAAAPAVPVSRLYTGVLYDALALGSLTGPAKRRANSSVVIVSALYGALRLTDAVAPYRLGMGVDLPGIGPLHRYWRGHLDAALGPVASRAGVIVDARSTTYVSAWPAPRLLADRWVHVRVPGASHHAKHARGLLARHLCAFPDRLRSVHDVAAAASDRFEARLRPPQRPGQPWLLDI